MSKTNKWLWFVMIVTMVVILATIGVQRGRMDLLEDEIMRVSMGTTMGYRQDDSIQQEDINYLLSKLQNIRAEVDTLWSQDDNLWTMAENDRLKIQAIEDFLGMED